MVIMSGITELLIHEGFPDPNSVGTERARDFLTNHIAGNNFADVRCVTILLSTVCFESESWSSGVYTALHAINESWRISSETVNKIHFHLLSKLLTLPPTTPGRSDTVTIYSISEVVFFLK